MTSAQAAARRGELSGSLQRVHERIRSACDAVSDVVALCQLGVTDIGENRDQEASAKIAALPSEVRERLHVHFIGQVQSNKAASLVSYVDTVHSIDRAKLVRALDSAAIAAGRDIGALVQVSLSEGSSGPGRGGMPPEGVAELANSVAAADHLTLRGVMAVAPLGVDPGTAFSQLAAVAHRVRVDHPEATWISAGMSADLEAAVANGATHLRVGTAILGSRPPFG
jgi:hypothetical protein